VKADNRRHQSGVALVTAVLIVALATALAAHVGFRGYLDQRRTANQFAFDQGFEFAVGGEAWAADVLKRDKLTGSPTDDFTEEWASPLPPIPVDGGEVSGQIEDMQGRFNLNSLVIAQDGRLRINEAAVTRFERLLTSLDLEKKWARLIVDWIDSDMEGGFPDGAEDDFYTALTPAYHTPNMPITRTSELLALPGFGAQRFQRLEPFVAALPVGTRINVCTASPDVLDALIEGAEEFTLARDNVLEMRKRGCFPSLQDFGKRLDADQARALNSMVTDHSSFFRAVIRVDIGNTHVTLYSVLYRPDSSNLVRPYQRSLGVP